MKQNITAGTVTRFIVLLVALVNSGLSMAGLSPLPFDEQGLATFIDLGFLGAASLWAYWKDNDVTPEARAQKKVTPNK
ncbi:holin protein [Bacillus sp. JCM 19047]|nr:holin protein [Bacillus sp. JCM 19047]